ncbi:MAG TPA: Crp/Fnr family transcriptional regulator [Nitrococcus sp.]|nr:Crp/Fnr family transcriptional regulator [Nitrococcus sp.]
MQSLENDPKNLSRCELLWHAGDRAQRFYTVKAGWVCTYRELTNGGRQVLEVFMPGDVIGVRNFAYPGYLDSAFMVRSGTVCPFPLKRLLDIFDESKILTVLFFAMASQEQALLVERMINLGRRSASQKLANFIAEIYIRIQRLRPDLGEEISLPLSQELIADILGLSTVHVNRTFAELRQRGLLYNHRGRVRIPDFSRLAKEGDFADEHLNKGIHELLSLALKQ